MTRMDRCTLILTVLMLGIFAGCQNDIRDIDSFMDPSVAGRWENTPIQLPILTRLEMIEESTDQIRGLDAPKAEDLIPYSEAYRLIENDLITVSIYELKAEGVDTTQTRRIDESGVIRLPVVGRIVAKGKTGKEIEQIIINRLKPDILKDPQVAVFIQEKQQRTFSIIGGANAPGTYPIAQSNFRLLNAIALGRGIAESAEYIYVIRHKPLKRIVSEGTKDPRVIDDPVDAIELAAAEAKATTQPATTQASRTEAMADKESNSGEAQWMHVNGRWVEVIANKTKASLPAIEQLVAERVIQIPVKQLLNGDAKYNIVIRPQDVIRVPQTASGVYFIGGAVNRPGTYNLPPNGRITLKQAVIAAGGFNPIAIPERVDLTRRLTTETEATIRLNLRAIFEGMQPDIYLKYDDTINVGTNLWAPFMTVIRNSFRSTYGFGFVIDRNFGPQIFGE